MYILFVCIFVSESAFSSSSRLRTESESQLGFMSAAYLRIGTSCYYARSLRSRKPLVQDWLAQFGPLVSPMTHGMKMRRKRRKKNKTNKVTHVRENEKRRRSTNKTVGNVDFIVQFVSCFPDDSLHLASFTCHLSLRTHSYFCDKRVHLLSDF